MTPGARHQRGYIYEAHNSFHVRYYVTEIVEGKSKRVQRSHRLCPVDRNKGYGARSAKAVQLLAEDHMRGINTAVVPTRSDMPVAEFWEKIYLPYCESQWRGTGMRATSVRSLKQIWNRYLKDHFGTVTLQQYTPQQARAFLSGLKTKQSKNSLKHIRAVASAMFSECIERGLVNGVNPWKVAIPKDCKDSEATKHYTIEQAEDLVSALVDHADCQLVIALACFLGLGPAEISGLQWGDIDTDWIHVRRNRPSNGTVGPCKTKECAASLPIIPKVKLFLDLWRGKCEDTSPEAWVIVDLPNLLNRVIKPHVTGETCCVRCERTPKPSGVKWEGLYAGRRGAVTAIIEATGGNYAVAQAIARHKSMTTTLNVYKKQITRQGLLAGMEQFSNSINK